MVPTAKVPIASIRKMAKKNFCQYKMAGGGFLTFYPRWVVKYESSTNDTSAKGVTVYFGDGTVTNITEESYDQFKLMMTEMEIET